MKKRVLIILITAVLLAGFVYAQQEKIPRTDSVTKLPKIERQTNFMGDNVHILLVEDLAKKMGVQVEELDQKLIEMQEKIEELERIKTTMQSARPTGYATGSAVQINDLNTELAALRKSINDIKNAQATAVPQKSQESSSNLGLFILLLLGLNGILLVLVTGLVVHNKAQKEQTKTLHEYIAQCLESGDTRQEIKKDLISEGWSSEQVEKAMKEI